MNPSGVVASSFPPRVMKITTFSLLLLLSAAASVHAQAQQPQVLRIASKRPRQTTSASQVYEFDSNHGRSAFLSSAIQDALDDLDSEDALPENVARIAPEGTSRLSRVVVALLLLLSLQGLWVQRHAIAAFWPATAPLLQEVCRLAGCSIQPWRAPERILIESSDLTPREGGFVLQWAVRNASAQHLGMTALELKLHDAQGKVLVQRVLLPAEIGAPAVLMTGQSWSGRLHLDVPADLSVTGYRLLTFYP